MLERVNKFWTLTIDGKNVAAVAGKFPPLPNLSSLSLPQELVLLLSLQNQHIYLEYILRCDGTV